MRPFVSTALLIAHEIIAYELAQQELHSISQLMRRFLAVGM
jgi:hypothetical protein